MKKLLLFVFVLPVTALSQDTVRLKEVEILDRSSSFIKHHNSISFDSVQKTTYQSKNLAELLAENTPAVIKSYGNGSLSTMSLRGTSSVHTSVLWNGIPVNLQSTGDFDLSLVTVSSFDKIRLVHGGASSFYGSGSVGGSVLLDDSPSFGIPHSLVLESSAGSFGKRTYASSIRLNYENISIKILGYLKEIENDYTFRNPLLEASSEQRLKYASVKGRGINSSVFYKHRKSVFAAHAWMEKYKRDIPAAPFALNPYPAKQEDLNFRSLAEYKFVSDDFTLNAKSAIITGALSYVDTVTRVNSETSSLTFFPEVSVIRKFRSATIFAGYNSSFTSAENTNYSNTKKRSSHGLFAGYNVTRKKASATLNIREDIFPAMKDAFTFNGSLSYRIFKPISLSLNGGTTYRVPSLNDLYWIPGGNPGLVPENGWFAQGTALFEHINARHKLTFSSTLFSNYVDNWIIWLPETAVIWTPRNLKEVWSRGIEIYGKGSFELGRLGLDINGSYSYTEATNESSDEPGIILHDQIIYVPYYTANGSFTLRYRQISLRYNAVFVGGRYTASDHTAALPSYHLAGVRIAYAILFTNQRIHLFLGTDNLYNKSYQVIDQRPMPGRSYEAGLSLILNHPK